MTWVHRIKCNLFSNTFTLLQKPKGRLFHLFFTFRFTVLDRKHGHKLFPSLCRYLQKVLVASPIKRYSLFFHLLNLCQLQTCFRQWNSTKHDTNRDLKSFTAGFALLLVLELHDHYVNKYLSNHMETDPSHPRGDHYEPASSNQSYLLTTHA